MRSMTLTYKSGGLQKSLLFDWPKPSAGYVRKVMIPVGALLAYTSIVSG